MLCEKCKNLKESTLQGIKAKCFKMGFNSKPVAHQVNGEWFPGATPKDLEDWCAKNCKPAKPAKPVEEKSITPKISNEKSVSKDKKKD